MTESLLLVFVFFALFGVSICFYIKWINFISLILTGFCVILGFYACLYLTDKPSYSVLLAVCVLRASGFQTGCKTGVY